MDVLIVNIDTFYPFSSVCIVYLEQVNANWVIFNIEHNSA